MQPPHLNLIAAWLGILSGFASGLALGLFFQREDWLGGYASLKRRLYRLAHISCFGLGAVNLLFYFTALSLPAGTRALAIASWAFIAGAIAMPICCCLMAHVPSARPLFAIPVLSLLLGGALTVSATFQAAGGPSLKATSAAPSTEREIRPSVSPLTSHPSQITDSSQP
jgi:hypothetical protein